MQSIHILGDQGKVGAALLQLCQGKMAGVGAGLSYQTAAPVVPLPHQVRVSGEGLGRGQFRRVVLVPESVLAAKRGNARFGGDPRPRADHHVTCGGDPVPREPYVPWFHV